MINFLLFLLIMSFRSFQTAPSFLYLGLNFSPLPLACPPEHRSTIRTPLRCQLCCHFGRDVVRRTWPLRVVAAYWRHQLAIFISSTAKNQETFGAQKNLYFYAQKSIVTFIRVSSVRFLASSHFKQDLASSRCNFYFFCPQLLSITRFRRYQTGPDKLGSGHWSPLQTTPICRLKRCEQTGSDIARHNGLCSDWLAVRRPSLAIVGRGVKFVRNKDGGT